MAHGDGGRVEAGWRLSGEDVKESRHVSPPSSVGRSHEHERGAPGTGVLSDLLVSTGRAISSKLSGGSREGGLPSHTHSPHGPPPSRRDARAHGRTMSVLPDRQELSGLLRPPSVASLKFAGLCALWYTSSAMSSNTGKVILARFRYPVTLTWVQFGFVAVYCALFCAVREHMAATRGRPLAKRFGSAGWGVRRAGKVALQGTFVMSLFQIAGHVFSSMAIARVPVSTVHTIKALSPLFTVASYALLFGVRYSPATYVSLMPLTLGVMLACSFDLRANAFGFLCALGSTLVFVSQNIFSKKLLPRESSSGHVHSSTTPAKLDKLNLLLYSSAMAFILMIPIWLYTDGATLLGGPSAPRAPGFLSLFMLFSLNGSVHFAQCLLAFTILARCSPVTYSVASLFKRLAVIILAIVWFAQPVYLVQLMGMLLTFVGLGMYNRAKEDVAKGERKRVTHERRNSFLLPTTTADAKLADTGSLSPISDASGFNTPAAPQSYFPTSGHAHPHPAPFDSGVHQRGGTSPRSHSPAPLPPKSTGGWNDLPSSFAGAPPPPRAKPPHTSPPPAPASQLV